MNRLFAEHDHLHETLVIVDFGTQPFLEINPGQHDFGGPGHLECGAVACEESSA